MRSIHCHKIINIVSALFQDACIDLPEDVTAALKKARKTERSLLGRQVLNTILKNIEIASVNRVPLCQDTGTAVVFLELGQEVHVTGGDLYEAINEGVRKGYEQGFLRKSITSRPFSARKNTGDNTPAVIHTEIVKGDGLKICALPKGGGAENCSRLVVLPPAKGPQAINEYVINLIDECGCNACPPLIIGIGIGGTTEKTMLLAKKALLRPVGNPNADKEVASLEKSILNEANKSGIGPMGYGGRVTALAVHIETFPAHIASLPIAVNLQCWCSRHKEATL